jgi:hypothetical protein
LESGILGEVRAQNLDGNTSAKPKVASLQDLGHTSAAKGLTEFVSVAESTRFAHNCSFSSGSIMPADRH